MHCAHPKLGALALIFLACLILAPSPGRSEIPQTISYQGSLTDAAGNPVTKTVGMVFALYASPSTDIALWTEKQTVTVTNGTFHVVLGAAVENPLTAPVFKGPLYLGIAVEGDAEMVPRQALASVGYAFRSAAVVPDAVTGEGLAAASVTTGKIADGAITAVKIGEPCLTGQVLKRSGPTWACAADDNDNSALEAAVAGHETRIVDLEKAVADLQTGLASALGAIGKLQTDLAAANLRIAGLSADLAAVQANSVLALDTLLILDTAGNYPTVRFTGVNVQVTNGVAQTTLNGTGNLIIGFNELRGTGDDRSGSHNLVVGDRQNYTSYGGLVAGSNNTILAPYASVGGGTNLTSGSANAWAAAGLSDNGSVVDIIAPLIRLNGGNPAARLGDQIVTSPCAEFTSCPGTITRGSATVFIGG